MASQKFAAGMRVQYFHGKGLSTGTIESIDGDQAVIETKNGAKTKRLVSRLQKASKVKAPPASPSI